MEDLETVHEYLDRVEAILHHLREVRDASVDVDDVGDLCLLVGELHGWGTVYGGDNPKLAITPSVLNRYVKFRGPFQTREALLVADRIRGFLRSLDQREISQSASDQPVDNAPRRSSVGDSQAQLIVEADGWRVIGSSGALKTKILALSALLDSIIERAQGINYPPQHAAITPLERKQLIAILETALALLRAPMVERGLLRTLKDMLSRTARKTAEKEVERGLGAAAELASERLGDLLNRL